LKKEGKDFPTYLFVSNYHIDLPPSPPKHRSSKNKIATPLIDSYVPSSEIPPLVDPPSLPFEEAIDFVPSALTPETNHPFGSTIPHASEKHQSSQKPISSKPSLAQVYRGKRKERAQETVIEEQEEPLVEIPQMEIEDNPPIIQSTVDTLVLRISSMRKLVLSEEFVPSSEMVEPSDKLSKFKYSPLEKEALEAIFQLRDSPPEPSSEAEQGPKEDWAQLFKEEDS
jgi:hypothetical protein